MFKHEAGSLKHPDPDRLSAYGLGRLDDAELTEIEAHLEECPDCLAAVAATPEDPLVSLFRSAAHPHSGEAATLARAGLSDTSPVDAAPTQFEFLAPPQTPDEIGRLGPYRVFRLLGAGGMGLVFLAEDPQLRRKVAVKVLRPALAADAGARRRFLKEAQAMAALEHDHIVPVYQVGEDRGVPFLAMPFLHGETVSQRLKREGRLPLADALRIGREIALGLAAAHERGLIHRDIKPGNIFLSIVSGPLSVAKDNKQRTSDDGQRIKVKVLDFGLAHIVEDEKHVSQFGILAGTPAYMAPEQLDGSSVDARADLFSLGCVLYEMLSGRLPFEGRTSFETLNAIAHQEPTPICELNPDVPPALADLVSRLLAKNPAARPATAWTVVEALGSRTTDRRRATDRLPAQAREVGSEAEKRRNGETGIRTMSRRFPASLMIALLGVIVAAVLLGGVIYVQTDKGTLEIISHADDVKVILEQGGKEIQVIDPKTNQRLEIRSGVYRLRLGEGSESSELDRDEVTLKRGERVVVEVRLRTAPPAKVGEVRRFVGHEHRFVECAVFSPDGRRVLSCGHDKTVRLWDRDTGRELYVFNKHALVVFRAVFLPNGREALSCSADRTLRLWNCETGNELRVLRGHTDEVHDVALSPDGRRALSASYDGTLRLWDLQTGQSLWVFEGHENNALKVAFSPDGRRALSAGVDGTVRLWDVETREEIRRFLGHYTRVWCVAFAPDGRRAASAGDDERVRLWDLETGKELRQFKGHGEMVRSVIFLPDGRRLLSGGHKQRVILWDVESGHELLSLPDAAGAVHLAVAPDGRHALSAGNDGSVRLWRLPDSAPSP